MWKRYFDVARKGKVVREKQRPHFLLRNTFSSGETANYKLGWEKECSQKMVMTVPALIHFSDSDNKVTNEISDCPGVGIALVVKECRPPHRQNHTSLEKVVPLCQLFMYVLNFVFGYETLDLRLLANPSASKRQAGNITTWWPHMYCGEWERQGKTRGVCLI